MMFIVKKLCKFLKEKTGRLESEMALPQTPVASKTEHADTQNDHITKTTPSLFVDSKLLEVFEVSGIKEHSRDRFDETGDNLKSYSNEFDIREDDLGRVNFALATSKTGKVYEINGEKFHEIDVKFNNYFEDLFQFEIKEATQDDLVEDDNFDGGTKKSNLNSIDGKQFYELEDKFSNYYDEMFGVELEAHSDVSDAYNALDLIDDTCKNCYFPNSENDCARVNELKQRNGNSENNNCCPLVKEFKQRNGNGDNDNDCGALVNEIAVDSNGCDSGSCDGHENDSHNDDGDFEDVEINPQTDMPVSYAAMLKKPKPYEIQKQVLVKLGDKYARVQFDSWHMIVMQRKTKNFYCMACKHSGEVRYKLDHCVGVSHVENLMKCSLVGDYEHHVVRMVHENLYHCAHCNNLIMIHQMQDHIDSTHNKIMSKNTTDKATRDDIKLRDVTASPKPVEHNSANDDNEKIAATITHNDTRVNNANDSPTLDYNRETNEVDANKGKTLKDNGNINNDSHIQTATKPESVLKNDNDNQMPFEFIIPNVPPSEADTIIIIQFGHTLKVSLLSYHFIHLKNCVYNCCICRISCGPNLIWHHMLGDPKHTKMVQQTPFWPQCGIHLIRPTMYGLHCLLCNLFLHLNQANHLTELNHQYLLNKAIAGGALQTNPLNPSFSPQFNQYRLQMPLVRHPLGLMRPQTPVEVSKNTRQPTNQQRLKENTMSHDNQEIDNRNKVKAKTDANVNATETNLTKTALSENQLDKIKNNSTSKSLKQSTTLVVDTEENLKQLEVQNKNIIGSVNVTERNVTKTSSVECKAQADDIMENRDNEKDKKYNLTESGATKPVDITEERINQIDDRNERDNDKNETEIQVTETFDAVEFNPEEYLYVKIKTIYAKITTVSYNSLVQIGNGSRFCCVCSIEVYPDELKMHVTRGNHLKNLNSHNFLENFEKHLIRQISASYHCAICNVIVRNGYLVNHLSWAHHNENFTHEITKHARRNEIKAGAREIACATQKEIANSTEHKFNVIRKIEFIKDTREVVKKEKLVQIFDVVLKISWNAYQGLFTNKTGYRCLICGADVKNYEVNSHVVNLRHVKKIDTSFILEYAPSLIRMLDNSMLQCLTCNVEFPNVEHTINNHIAGKRHDKKFITSLGNSTDIDSADNRDILKLALTLRRGVVKKKS